MKSSDLHEIDHGAVITAVCVIGSRPAGAAIARERAGSDTELTHVESGGVGFEADIIALYDTENERPEPDAFTRGSGPPIRWHLDNLDRALRSLPGYRL